VDSTHDEAHNQFVPGLHARFPTDGRKTATMKPVDPDRLTTRRGGLSVTRIGVNLGAEIGRADLTRPLSQEAFEAISAALVEHEVIVFRDQRISSDHLLAFGRRFGDRS
jgi:hypothetical protein